MRETEDDGLGERETSPADSLISEVYISEDEWDVEDLLAERVMKGAGLGRPAGEKCWLVKWTGFELAEATWEPREHLTDELLQKWEDEKQKHLAGTKQPFRVREWKRAAIKYWEAKIAKQKKSNQRRKMAGQEIEPIDSIDHAREALKSVDSEDDSEDDVDWARLDREAEDPASNSDSSPDDDEVLSSSETDIEEPTNEETARPRPSRDEPLSVSEKDKPTAREKNRSGSVHGSPLQNTYPPPSNQGKPRKEQERSQTRPAPAINQAPTNPGLKASGAASRKQVSNTVRPSRPASASTVLHRTTTAPASRAIKTQRRVNPENAGNVFSGGKKPRTRMGFDESWHKSKAAPRFFSYSEQRRLEKRLRDNEGTRDPRLAAKRSNTGTLDAATDRRPAEAVGDESSLFMTPDPDSRPGTSSQSERQGPSEDLETLDTGIIRTHGVATTSQQQSLLLSTNTEPPPPVQSQTDMGPGRVLSKKTESVHFFDNESDAMALDSDEGMTTLPEDTPLQIVTVPPEALKNVTKICKLGSRTLEVIFKSLTKEVLESHLEEFVNAPSLCFSHQCSEDDFVFCESALQSSVIVRGHAKSTGLSTALRSLNERLSVSRLALLCYTGSLCIRLSCTSSKASTEASLLDTSQSTDELAFVIFRPVQSFEAQILDSFDIEGYSQGQSIAFDGSFDLDRFLKFRYERLLPPSLSGDHLDSQAVFFLLFPPSRAAEYMLLANWLQQCNDSCEVLSTFGQGHWSVFKSLNRGVVIIHQDALEMIRLLPDIGKLLWSQDSTNNFSFWTFGTSPQQPPSDAQDDDASLRRNAEHVRMERILPAGTVFLLTPSFLLAQPECAYGFLKWFSKAFVESPRPTGPVCKLALFGNPELWLSELLDEIASGSLSRPDGLGSLEVEVTVRSKTQRLIAKLLAITSLEEPDYLCSPLVLAPVEIDGNDEQSLVNWFSWWAMKHLNMFRRFEVVGTGHSDRFRLTRHVRGPHYRRSSLVDPGAPIDAEEAEETGLQKDVAPVPSQTLREAVLAIQERLRLIEREFLSKSLPLAILFRKPVSYFGPGMAVHLGDPGAKLATFEEWFSFFLPIEKIIGSRNTFVGFFYTVEDDWDPDTHPADVAPPSRPWFAIFRPQNPNRKPWVSTELLIWDMFLNRKFSDADEIFEGDLIPAQMALISMVVQKNRERNPQAPLQQVWIGGFQSSDASSNPLQHTLDRLTQLFENFRSDLPARSDFLPKSGWKAVRSGSRPAGLQLRSAIPRPARPRVFTVGESDTEDDKTCRKIVFHPPKGDSKRYSREEENRLLKHTQKVKDQGNRGKSEFLFAPTQQWYGFLRASNRHSEHIRVVQWTTIFNELGLPTRQH